MNDCYLDFTNSRRQTKGKRWTSEEYIGVETRGFEQGAPRGTFVRGRDFESGAERP